jgi:carboxylate-amine ligase
VIDFIDADAAALGCKAEIKHLLAIVAHGTSADRQIEIFGKAKAAGRRRLTALKEVVDWAAAETQALGSAKS